MSRRDSALLLTVCILLGVDILTKQLVVSFIARDHGRIDLAIASLVLVHVRNPGAAFGFMRDAEAARHVLIGISTLASIGIFASSRLFPRHHAVGGLATGFALAGVLGNLVDRIFRGNVVDMIVWSPPAGPLRSALIATLGSPQWPAFNVADAAITLCVPLLGAAMLALDEPDPSATVPKEAPLR